jgi:predicted GTPase
MTEPEPGFQVWKHRMIKKTIQVTFTAQEHMGKTTLEAAFAKLLAEHGIAVRMPPDPQRDEKMALPMEELLAKFRDKGVSVMLMESNST